MATALVALATTTLASSSATVTFSSIPATYRDLRIVVAISSSVSQYLDMYINGDTGSNYSGVTAYGNGTSAASYAGTGTWINFANQIVGNNDYTIDIMDYSATDKHKTVLSRSNSASQNVVMQANRWANTAAITNIQFFRETGGTLPAGSTFSLYGIVS